MRPPKSLGRQSGGERLRSLNLRPGETPHCPNEPWRRKGDPPRGPLRGACVDADYARDRGDRADLRGFGDGGGGRVGGWQNGPRRSNGGCSRRVHDRSACRWRRRSRSQGIGPAALAASQNPRLLVQSDEDITIDPSECPKTCDNPGWSSLCLEDRGSSNRGLGAVTPGPHLVLGTIRQKCGGMHRSTANAGTVPCGNRGVGVACRGSSQG